MRKRGVAAPRAVASPRRGAAPGQRREPASAERRGAVVELSGSRVRLRTWMSIEHRVG